MNGFGDVVVIDSHICFCQNCGFISVENDKNSCLVCNSNMKKTGETLQSLLDKYRNNPYELSTYVTTLLSECNKDALKANHKAIKQHWASFFSKETQVRLKQPVLICDSCGHIPGASCLFNDADSCCICNSRYMKAKESTLDYFIRRESYTTPAINAYEDKLRKKCCSSMNESLVRERERIEDTYLPSHIESVRIDTELPSYLQGFIPSLMNASRESNGAKVAIWSIFLILLSCISLCENALKDSNLQASLWIKELLTNTFNVLRCQGFSGQQNAARIIMSIILDLSKQILGN